MCNNRCCIERISREDGKSLRCLEDGKSLRCLAISAVSACGFRSVYEYQKRVYRNWSQYGNMTFFNGDTSSVGFQEVTEYQDDTSVNQYRRGDMLFCTGGTIKGASRNVKEGIVSISKEKEHETLVKYSEDCDTDRAFFQKFLGRRPL